MVSVYHALHFEDAWNSGNEEALIHHSDFCLKGTFLKQFTVEANFAKAYWYLVFYGQLAYYLWVLWVTLLIFTYVKLSAFDKSVFYIKYFVKVLSTQGKF